MRRPSRITVILLTTGIPPLAFAVALFVLGGIPQDVAPYLTIALVLVPATVFLPLCAFVWFRYTSRTWRRRFQKAIPTSCIICGEPLPKSPLRRVRQVQGPHYQNTHSDFWRWEEKWRKVFLALALTLAAVTFYELAITNYVLFILGISLSVILALAWSEFEKRKLRSFRNQWRLIARTGMNS